MRLISRLVGLALVILAAFWFAAANADELVLIDLVFVRIRASLPLVVFGSVLAGMGLSFLVAWRANRGGVERMGIRGRRRASLLAARPDPFGATPPGLDRRETELSDLHGPERPEGAAPRDERPVDPLRG